MTEAENELKAILPSQLPLKEMQAVGQTFKKARKFDEPIIERLRTCTLLTSPEREVLRTASTSPYTRENSFQ